MKDSRSFDYFRHNATLALMGFDRKSEFWARMVPQLSESSTAVMRAVLALSALYEETHGGSGSDVVFLRQYNKSIRQLCAGREKSPVQLTLTCCVLFITLENLAGDHLAALSHLRSGLALLKEWLREELTSVEERADREVLTVVFRRLDMQATTFLGSRQPELVYYSDEESAMVQAGCKEFGSLVEAQLALEGIEIRLFYTLTLKSFQGMQRDCAREQLLQGLSARFEEWKASFDAFGTKQSALSSEDRELSLLLDLHYESTTTMIDLNSSSIPDITVSSPSLDPQFARMNELCCSLLHASSNSTFAADTGIIAPLYFSAMNAHDVRTREEAMGLLRSMRGREGFWNGRTAAAIAEKVLRSEAEGAGLRLEGGVMELVEAYCITCC